MILLIAQLDPTLVNEFIYNSPIIFVGNSFYVFGGYTDISGFDTTIGKLNENVCSSYRFKKNVEI